MQMRLWIGIISLAFLVATFEFVRKKRLREEYAILWLLTALFIAVLSFWPGVVELLSRITGLYYLTSVVLVVFVFLIAVLMHYSVVISKMKETNKELVQKSALLEQKLCEIDERTKEKSRNTGELGVSGSVSGIRGKPIRESRGTAPTSR
jgi:Ca2+/Na+ antiporter